MWRPFRWRPSKIDMKRCCQGGDERDESRAEMHPRNKCKANVSLQHVSSYLQRVASICSSWMTPHSNLSASNETFLSWLWSAAAATPSMPLLLMIE